MYVGDKEKERKKRKDCGLKYPRMPMEVNTKCVNALRNHSQEFTKTRRYCVERDKDCVTEDIFFPCDPVQ